VTQHDLEMLNQQALSNTTVVHPAAYPALVTCPISTGGVTRRVRLVRGWGGGVAKRLCKATHLELASERCDSNSSTMRREPSAPVPEYLISST
jgi:hypothetical protein